MMIYGDKNTKNYSAIFHRALSAAALED